MPMKCVFFSDTHLARKDTERHAFVTRFIRDVCTAADTVFVLGDLFEFYHGYDGYIYPWYRGTVDALRGLTAQGIAVHYLEGNHEFNMGAYLCAYAGIRCARHLVIELDGRKTFISHGDDVANALLRRILKSGVTYGLMDLLGPMPTWNIAMACRLFLSKRKRVYSEKVRDVFRQYAKQKLAGGYDAVVLAHTHMPDFVAYDGVGTQGIYLNTGDLVAHLSYGEYTTETGFAARTYECKKEDADAV
jgi:UDP-2,3-diacylglucosamine hydrolase